LKVVFALIPFIPKVALPGNFASLLVLVNFFILTSQINPFDQGSYAFVIFLFFTVIPNPTFAVVPMK